MATVLAIAALVAATALTVKFVVSEGFLSVGRIGGGFEVSSVRNAGKGRKVTFVRFGARN